MVAQKPLVGLPQAPGWWQRVRRTVCQARDEQLCLGCENALGAVKKLTGRADENGSGGSETVMILDSPEKQSKSDAGGTSGCYGAKNPESGNCDVRALESLVGRARTGTSLEKVRVECSSWILNVLQGRALLRARAECFATFALGAAVDGVDFGGGADSAEPPVMS